MGSARSALEGEGHGQPAGTRATTDESPHLKPILMATSVAVEPLSVKNTLDAQSLPGPSSSLSATCKQSWRSATGTSDAREFEENILVYPNPHPDLMARSPTEGNE